MKVVEHTPEVPETTYDLLGLTEVEVATLRALCGRVLSANPCSSPSWKMLGDMDGIPHLAQRVTTVITSDKFLGIYVDGVLA